MLTKKLSREEVERMAVEQIMFQEEDFTAKDIVQKMRAICDEDVETDEILDVVFQAIDFCLDEKLISQFDGDVYSLNSSKQTAYFTKNEEYLNY